MKDIQTLSNFLSRQYKKATTKEEKKKLKLLKLVIENMAIENCTIGKIKQILTTGNIPLTENNSDIEITTEDIINFLWSDGNVNQDNITRIQEESGLLKFDCKPPRVKYNHMRATDSYDYR